MMTSNPMLEKDYATCVGRYGDFFYSLQEKANKMRSGVELRFQCCNNLCSVNHSKVACWKYILRKTD